MLGVARILVQAKILEPIKSLRRLHHLCQLLKRQYLRKKVLEQGDYINCLVLVTVIDMLTVDYSTGNVNLNPDTFGSNYITIHALQLCIHYCQWSYK